jgi:predicted AlkP superfamily pyrophosphatase or phosphodiesterase
MRMKRYLALGLILALSGCVTRTVVTTHVAPMEPRDAFWMALAAHCGNAYEGRLVVAPPGDEMLRGDERLIAHFRECEDRRLLIPFHIETSPGEWDRSRTWIYTHHGDSLELRHDHRRPDGSEDEQTQYGGFTLSEGTGGEQEFVFAERRAQDGSLLGWRIQIVPGERYTYGTFRGDAYTWRVDFDLSRPVQAPPAPWGYPPLTSGGRNAPEHLDAAHVVLVSFDGFRHDYAARQHTPSFDRLAAMGVSSRGLVPVFPSKTFPNYYSIATGMYPEQHGVMGNRFWDPDRGALYSISDRATVEDGTWYGGEPLWVTAERQGMVAASYFWIGSEADVLGVRPTIWNRYDHDAPNEGRVDEVLEWLSLPPETRPRMITLYFALVDDAGHGHGPDSPQTRAAVDTADVLLGRLLDGIAALPHGNRVAVVLVSDHGMAATGPEYFDRSLEELVSDTAGIRVVDDGPAATIFVSGGPERQARVRDELNAGLRHGRAYLRAELPERFRFSASPRAGDIVVVMEEPYLFGTEWRRTRISPGTHGWDPASRNMHGIFYAMGPGIAAGRELPEVENVHVYALITRLLGLRPNPEAASLDPFLPVLEGEAARR